MSEKTHTFETRSLGNGELKCLPSKNISQLPEWNATSGDFSRLIESLDKLGKTRHKLFSGSRFGPVLVIFEDHHGELSTQEENFLAFGKTANYYDFLVTEGTDKEIDLHGESYNGNINQVIALNQKIKPGLSSPLIEAFFGKDISTCGIDMPNNNLIAMEAINIGNMVSATKTGNWSGVRSYMDSEMTDGRSKYWMDQIMKLLQGNNPPKNGKHFIALNAGGDHSNLIGDLSGNLGFKGYIIFTPKSFPEKRVSGSSKILPNNDPQKVVLGIEDRMKSYIQTLGQLENYQVEQVSAAYMAGSLYRSMGGSKRTLSEQISKFQEYFSDNIKDSVWFKEIGFKAFMAGVSSN